MSQLRSLIEPQALLSISAQCQFLGLGRSSYYYEKAGESKENLALMLAIDKLHTQYPFFGVERIKTHLAPLLRGLMSNVSGA